MASQTIVNAWNEWDPLKHVIVGVATGTQIQAPELAVRRDWGDWGFPLGEYGTLPDEALAKANEQLDNFSAELEKRGVRVDRPTPLDFSQEIQTPDWVQNTMFGCMPPRDCLVTVGNEILEVPMSYRSRWFETLAYRPLLESYFREDSNFKWEAAPKPRLTEASYKDGWWETWDSLSEDEQWEYAERTDWILTEEEPLFDAADVVRFGKDLVVQKSMTSNDAAISWLQRHFPDHRVHKATYRTLTPMHLDSTLVPLREGLVLVNPERPDLDDRQIQFFKQNDWEMIPAPLTQLKDRIPLTFTSMWLNMNLLVLDPKTVFVEEIETQTMELLDQYGFDVIPVPFWDVAPCGGGLHCATVDVYREGTMEDYFPYQIPGF